MNQVFSHEELMKLCRKDEWKYYDISKEELIEQINLNFNSIINGTFAFDIVQTGDYFQINDLSQKLIIRKLNDNIKRLYKDEQSNRRIIIKQIKTLLHETVPMWILKTDIESFYESIDRNRLLVKLKNDSILSYHSIYLIQKLFSEAPLSSTSGLPRGLSISSTLSEMYMRKFDRWIKSYPSVYYYARFVDDIIVFSNSAKGLEELKNSINSQLEVGLRKKEVKTELFNGENIRDSRPLEYLGYKFTTSLNPQKKRELRVSIARKKVKKIKTRITLSFCEYSKSENFELLQKRIQFLTGNYSIKRNEDSEDLKAGIFYNYCYLNHFFDLTSLNLYYRKIIYCKKGRLGILLSSKLSDSQKDTLLKYSFIYGHKNKVYHSFSADEMKDIKLCWK